MIKQIEGIIVSTVDYKESSKILNILTPNDGIIGVLAKGSKNIKSKISAVSNILTYGIFYLNYHKGSIPILKEVDLLNPLKNIRKDIIKLNYSLFLLELSTQVCKHDKNEEVYKLLISGLIKINEGYDTRIITNILELKMLEHLGIKPEINRCVNCQKKTDIITISSYKGGYLCKDCLGSEEVFNIKTLQIIKMFYCIDVSKIKKIDVSDDIKKEISLFIDDYYERYSGLYLKSKSFLEEFSKLEI